MNKKTYNTELERLKKVIKWLVFSDFAENDKDLADKLGYNKTYLSQIFNGKVSLSDNFIDKLIELDPNINKVWIKEGIGSIFNDNKRNNYVSQNTSEDKTIIKELRNIIVYKDNTIKDKDDTISLLRTELQERKDELKEKTSQINRLLSLLEKNSK